MGPEAAKDFVEFLAAKGMCMRNGQIVPVEDPRVLRRALNIMHERGNLRWDVDEWIRIAREELESEAGK